MERLLAYEGPVVHVDHGHRAPARATGLEWRDCDEEVALEKGLKKIEQDKLAYTMTELAKEKRHKEMAKDKHREMVDQMAKEASGRMEAEEALARERQAFRDASAYQERVQARHEKEVEELEATVKVRDQELKRASDLIGEMKASELSHSDVIDMYQKEALALNDKLEHQAARIRELTEENDALRDKKRTLADSYHQLEGENMALKMEAVVDNRNYMEVIRGTDTSALPRFLAVHAMRHTKATRPPVDQEARAFILWIQKKIVEELGLDEAVAKERVNKDEWVV